MEKDFKKVNAQIIGVDGNVFNLLGVCQRELKRNRYYAEADELANRVYSSHNYEEALQIMLDYVNPVSKYDETFSEDDFDNIGI